MIGLHFTNYKASWGGNAPFLSTGFVESLVRGARQFLNVGVGDPIAVRHAFQHHGTRCNKPRVRGVVSIAAVVIFDLTGLPIQQGYDGPLHRQVNVEIPASRVLGWFEISLGMDDTEFKQKCMQITGRRSFSTE